MSINIQPNKNRIEGIDGLRGFALFGILIVNIFVFHAPYAHYGEFYFQFTGLELFALINMIFFFGGKFMFIFAFLFGYGCWMQYEKNKDIVVFRNFWWRRMCWLALFGLLHLLLLSYGDILLPYAILGMTLPFLLRCKNWSLLILFLLVYNIPVYEFIGRQWLGWSSIFTQSDISLAEDISINATGSFREIFTLRMKHYWSFSNEKLIMYIPKEWSLFVFGIIASRRKLASELPVKKTMIFSFIGIVIVIFWYFFRPAFIALFQLENSFIQPLVLGLFVQLIEFVHGMLYVVGFWLLWRLTFFQKLFYPLKYAGRMSLTIYIMQSFICAIIFCSYGFGMYGSQTPIELLLLATFIFLIQCIFAICWFEKFQFGPLEWLWRKLSYGKIKA